MKLIYRNVRKQTLICSIVPTVFLLFLIITVLRYPFQDIFSPKQISYLSELENEYTSRRDYVHLTHITLYYTGYDCVVKDKITGRYYYALENNRCFFFLLNSEAAMKAPDSLTFDSLRLKLGEANSDFSVFLDNLSSDIDWNIIHLTEASTEFVGYEYRDILYYSYVLAALLFVMALYTIAVLIYNGVVLFFPFLQKNMLPCPGFSKRRKLFQHMSAKAAKEQDKMVSIRFTSRGRKEFIVTPSLLIYFSTYDTHMLLIQDIIWIYKHVTKPAHGISKASSLYTIHFILNTGKHIQFKNCPEKKSDALIALLAGKNINILIGYSEEHKTLAKKYLKYIDAQSR